MEPGAATRKEDECGEDHRAGAAEGDLRITTAVFYCFGEHDRAPAIAGVEAEEGPVVLRSEPQRAVECRRRQHLLRIAWVHHDPRLAHRAIPIGVHQDVGPDDDSWALRVYDRG